VIAGARGPVAAVDIGTNSVRLLIADASGGEIVREMRMTRLGQGVDVARRLAPEAVERTVRVIAEYAQLIAHHGGAPSRTRAVATSAARDAENRADFFDSVERALGVRPELLSGDDEARLSFAGATRGLDPAEGPFLVIDIGGGSTEIVLGTTAPEAVVSVPLGCVRMTERHLASDPPTAAEIGACVADVTRTLGPVRAAIDVGRARRVIGLAGTVAALAGLKLGLRRYDAARTHHARLTRAEVEAMFERLARATVAERRAMLAEPARAETIVGGAAVLATILRELDLTELTASETDILDGLTASLLEA
jgi:exopolyphosphatase/guanosine-5'-triphosphate,3'-diphosphate pyrophosphatase